MTFEDAIATLIPDEWTAWQLVTRQRKTRFVFTMTRLVNYEEEESNSGHGVTPVDALCDALRKLHALPIHPNRQSDAGEGK